MKNYFLNFEKKKFKKKNFKKNKENFFFLQIFLIFFEVFQFSGGFRKNGQNRFLKKKLEQILSYSPLLGHCGWGGKKYFFTIDESESLIFYLVRSHHKNRNLIS